MSGGSLQRVGVLGGTFDPIHYAHLAMAEEVRWALGLNRVFIVPNAQQPLKQEHGATPEQRLEMVRLACRDNPALVPSAIEVTRASPSYTVDTLRAFQAQFGAAAELWFVLGNDAVNSLPRWHEAPQIVTLARLAVVARPDYTVDLAVFEQALPGAAGRVRFIKGPLLSISSTGLRQRIAAGQPVRYQLPEAVLDYIRSEGLYAARRADE